MKVEVGQSSAFLRSATGSNFHASLSSANASPICIIFSEHDAIENLHAAGAFHASKSKLNTRHVMRLTNNWIDIAVYIGDNALVNRLMIGDLGANSSFYHKCCSTNLHNRFTKKQKEECKGKIDTDNAKAAAWDRVIAFMNETLLSVAKESFDLHELENVYLDYLSEYEILIESHITQFGENLIERAQEYEVIKMDKKQRVFRKESMHEMFSVFLKESRSWIQSIRTIVQPIRHDIFKNKNSFDGNLMDKKQDEDISPFLLSLTSMLVDGEINTEGKCSQAALTVAGLITYNIRTIKRPRITNLNNHHHDKEKETSINIYVGLKLYSTVRSRTFIDCLFQIGMCILYDRIFSTTNLFMRLCALPLATIKFFYQQI